MDRQRLAYRLVRRPVTAAEPPVLDRAQAQVVGHSGGPLLVLAGPGTGKTTAIVETVVDRIAGRGLDPGRVLVLTFSRKAAQELRARITLRLNRTTTAPLALTFHSYAYALVRRESVLAGEEAPILLSGPEQLQEVRRMLRGEASDGARQWPQRLRPLLATRGFAAELRDFLLRAAERGLDGAQLARLGRQLDRDDWVAAGGFLIRYAARFDLAPVPAYDYPEIIRIAGQLLARPEIRQRERLAYDVVLVDEFQDTDPAQEELLHALAGDGRELIVVGDPDQSIYAFRGADSDAISRFPARFRAPDGHHAAVIALGTCRRSGPVLLAASRRIAARLPAVRLPEVRGTAGLVSQQDHRALVPQPSASLGAARVVIAASERQEAALVADTLRRAHLIEHVPWSSMAVLVRSAVRQVPALQRALSSAGVPVAVAGDELPLADDPGTGPVLRLIGCALDPRALTEDAAADLLTGPLGGTDALGLRRLHRLARQRDAEPPASAPAEPAAAAGPLAAALLDPRLLSAAGWRPGHGLIAAGEALAAARRVAQLLAVARTAAAAGTAQEVLWAVWDASGLARQWHAASAAGGTRGATADADLDAVMALFDAAARFDARMPAGSMAVFLDSLSGQEIAGDTLAERGQRGEAVTISTAHRAKGLEWDLVVVAGAQEGSWPDLRLRGSLLGMDELVEAADRGLDPTAGAAAASDAAAVALSSKLLDEERRLFYVAVTRARRSLVVTAVGGEDSEERPSRFLAELAGDEIAIEDVAGSGRRWLSLPALTADLRRAAADRGLPRPVRAAAAAQLARLAAAGVPGAGPAQWYALTQWSGSGPISDGEVRVSPSQVDKFVTCGLRWLIESAVGAGPPSVAGHLGTVIHAAAALVAEGADRADIAGRIDEIWHQLDFGSVWYSSRQRENASQMVARFVDWHRANPRDLIAIEQKLRVRIDDVLIAGQVDRLERDADGRAVVVDLKTGSSKPPAADLDRNPQLGVYQLAVLLGAFIELGATEPGGAELVHVGRAARPKSAAVQSQRALADDPDPSWAQTLVKEAAAAMAGPQFKAAVNEGCRRCPAATSCPVDERGGQVTP
jgi:superfamily I DNA/RNA helicase/RecB family exonuclease